MNPVIIGNATLIYAICEYPGLEPRYVGKTTKSLNARFKQHIRKSIKEPRLPVHRWIAKRSSEDKYICIRLLEIVSKEDKWEERECYWINLMRNRYSNLLNLTDGGEGLSGHVFSEEHIKKIADKIRTGSEINCLHCGNTFWATKGILKEGNGKFCSRVCYQLHQLGKTKDSVLPPGAIEKAAELKRNQTHCKRGHLLSGDNLYLSKDGNRVCKECRKLNKSNYLNRLNSRSLVCSSQNQMELV